MAMNIPVRGMPPVTLPLSPTDLFYVIQGTSSGDRKIQFADLSNSITPGGSATIFSSSYTSPPATPHAGDLWMPTGSIFILRWNGANWIPWGPIYPFTIWDDTAYAWVNQGGATIDTTLGGVYLTAPVGAGNSLRIRKKAVPGGSYTFTAFIVPPAAVGGDFNSFGLCFRASGSGSLATFAIVHSSSWQVVSQKWTDPTTFSATYVLTPISSFIGMDGKGFFLRIADDGVNRICSLSADGIHFTTFHSVGRTDFLTANEIGYFANAGGTVSPATMWILSLV